MPIKQHICFHLFGSCLLSVGIFYKSGKFQDQFYFGDPARAKDADLLHYDEPETFGRQSGARQLEKQIEIYVTDFGKGIITAA